MDVSISLLRLFDRVKSVSTLSLSCLEYTLLKKQVLNPIPEIITSCICSLSVINYPLRIMLLLTCYGFYFFLLCLTYFGVVQVEELTKKHSKKDTRSGAANGMLSSREQSEELVRMVHVGHLGFVYTRTMPRNATEYVFQLPLW